jgi:hypothetical protein
VPPKPKKPISVVDRRLASGSVFAASSRPIPLVDPKAWELRIINTQISDQRLWEVQADKGWVYAEPADIAVPVSELGLREQDGRIVRGTQGHEVLMKMPKGDYRRIQAMKDAENKTRTFGDKRKLKQDVVTAAAVELGDQAASFLNRASVTVTDSTERVSLEE